MRGMDQSRLELAFSRAIERPADASYGGLVENANFVWKRMADRHRERQAEMDEDGGGAVFGSLARNRKKLRRIR
jgi:hypothetical protein